MRKLLAVIILGILFKCNPLYADEKIHEDWVKADRSFIEYVIKKLKQQPSEIDSCLLTSDKKKENLGFGYYFISGSNGKGYVSIVYQFVYHNDQLISFKLSPQMPTIEKLIPIYKKFYENFFIFDSQNNIFPYHFDLTKVDIPLQGFQLNFKTSKKMRYYMTPYSGILYGYRGGYANSLTQNRRFFQNISNELNEDICLMLLYSINPASRLTAYEYFLNNRDKFNKAKQEKIEKRAQVVFEELPTITTMYGCIVTEENSRERVESLVNKSNKP